jgi:hypothetical protein
MKICAYMNERLNIVKVLYTRDVWMSFDYLIPADNINRSKSVII